MDAVKHLTQFVDILKLTRSEKFLLFNEGAVAKAFKWVDFVVKTMSIKKISEDEQTRIVSNIGLLHIHLIDEDPLVLVKDPLRALAMAFFSAPLLAHTKDVLSMILSGLIERIGRDAALNLCTDIMHRGYQSRKELINVVKSIRCSDDGSSSSSSCRLDTWSEEEDIFATLLINAMISHCHQEHSSPDYKASRFTIDLLFEKASKDDYIFLLLVRSCMLPMNTYLSSKLENTDTQDKSILSMTVNMYIGTKSLFLRCLSFHFEIHIRIYLFLLPSFLPSFLSSL